jgi:hypothetical protein
MVTNPHESDPNLGKMFKILKDFVDSSFTCLNKEMIDVMSQLDPIVKLTSGLKADQLTRARKFLDREIASEMAAPIGQDESVANPERGK